MTAAPAQQITMEDVQFRAALDPEWRAEFLADPKATLAGLGIDLRDEITVRVVDQADGELVIPIPPEAKAADVDELNEDALGQVNGGTILAAAATIIPEAAPVIGYGAAAAWTFGGTVVGGIAGWAASKL